MKMKMNVSKKVIKLVASSVFFAVLFLSLMTNIALKNRNNNLKKDIEILNKEVKAIETERNLYKFLAIERESQAKELMWSLNEWNEWSSRNQGMLDMLEDIWNSCKARGGC